MSARTILILSSMLVVLALRAPVPVLAQQAVGSAQAAPASPDVQKRGGISYVSGGVGDDSARAMKEIANQFNLQITLAGPNGEYLAATRLQIQDGSGKTVLAATSDGPLFYAALPAGEYKIQAMAPQGEAKTSTVTVSKTGHATVLIHLSA